MDVNTALKACESLKLVRQRLQVLQDLGLGYLTLGEETPGLSGGEAQRLKLASEMGKAQSDSVFVFDEPTIGLHPLDVRTLLGVFRDADRKRRHRDRDRARSGCDPQRRLHHRYGSGRRRGGRPDRCGRNAGSDPQDTGKSDWKIPVTVYGRVRYEHSEGRDDIKSYLLKKTVV